ncbi:MAG: hypothetical protein FWF77_09090 [Defluviitaleaceae bacterium]|nr:hypothetical protein [Defluviitaleaceae bacterium]
MCELLPKYTSCPEHVASKNTRRDKILPGVLWYVLGICNDMLRVNFLSAAFDEVDLFNTPGSCSRLRGNASPPTHAPGAQYL